MKPLKEALFSRKNLNANPYGLTEKNLIHYLEGFTVGIVVRMLEEQELQGNKADVKIFQKDLYADVDQGGFEWSDTEAGGTFWHNVIVDWDFDLFFKKYPEYERYNLA